MKNKKQKQSNNGKNILGVYQGIVIYFFSIAVMTPLFLFGYIHFSSGDYFIGYVELAMAIVVFLNIFFFRTYRNVAYSGTVLALTTFVVLQAVFITGGFHNTGIYWFFAYPFLVFFLLGRRTAAVWVMLMIVSVITQFVLSQAGYISINYSFIELRQALYVFITVCVLTYLYESIVEKRAGFLHEQKEQVSSFANRLMEINKDQERENALDIAILSNIGEGLVAVDESGKIILINKVALSLLKWENDEALGTVFADRIHVVQRRGGKVPKNKLAVSVAMTRGETIQTSRYDYIAADGTRFPVSITASPVMVSGEPAGAVVVFRDITNEVNIDRAKSEFISLVSHQLRTPLTAMNNYVEMFLNGDLGKTTKSQQESLDDMHEISQQSIKMVVDLLNVSRLESSMGFQVKPENVLLENFIKEVIAQESRYIKNHHCEVKFTSDLDRLKNLKLDQALMKHVLRNLISNAVKYSKHDRCSIVVNAKIEKGDVIISVTDTGIGIPKDDQQHIFERFYRGENARQTEGTGLGLYIAKMIVDVSGGRIWFESQEGKGTTFYVAFSKKGMKSNEGEKQIVL